MVKYNTLRWKHTIDKEIYPLVKILNNRGFKTLFSCSGHEYKDRAYISFKGILSRIEMGDITGVLREKGIKSELTWRKQYKVDNQGHQKNTTVYFKR